MAIVPWKPWPVEHHASNSTGEWFLTWLTMNKTAILPGPLIRQILHEELPGCWGRRAPGMMAARSRQKVVQEFALGHVAARHMTLYRELLKQT
jgi:hypothetical protein